ncbi:MAG: metallophosphoesterase family protein [Bacteroidota bacterium]|nr:metallophosphoesterase family protein [Bacteroidota bacterium]MDP4233510.1 metallophosphoesterase family protein [Bacteroidota bacterium]MDP4243387.1 metallophosphoesterase family protein [Bacteroidota bacterium]MDP4287926.1 metallophosphoesterase family protein [Bacteroidota bacterium]
MRTIVHLSDIHFGAVDERLKAPLVRAVHEQRPDLVVVSGDLTERGRRGEFREAREFLLSLPGPQIVVPGNHDVPIYHPIERLLHPMGRFRRFISSERLPFFEDDEIAAIGINTARATKTKYGHISRWQLAMIQDMLRPVPNDRIKIVVTHHPFDVPDGYRKTRQIVGRAWRAMKVLSECGADLFLAGHLHRIHAGLTAERYKIEDYSALVIQAGTATLFNGSQELNSFNVIHCERPTMKVNRVMWNDSTNQFEHRDEENFRHGEQGWSRAIE